jgi:hypothetical protein
MSVDHRKDVAMPDTIVAWQCIGCGRLEALQNCIGVCQDRKVELVSAWDHAEALVALEEAQTRLAVLDEFLARLTRTKPHEDAWKASYLALQGEARKLRRG